MLTESIAMEIPAALTPVIAGVDAPQHSASPYEFRAIAAAAHDRHRKVRVGRAQEDLEQQQAMDLLRREALDEGRREGQRCARAELEAEAAAGIAQERARITDAVQEFRERRNQYFMGVEKEVVRLALAIAARVLHREAQLDPLLLAGAVRVALGQLADRSGVVLRVPSAEAKGWQMMFEAMEPADRPAVVAGAALSGGECVLETSMGSVELGISAQLEEIEHGFFDLLSHRPTP